LEGCSREFTLPLGANGTTLHGKRVGISSPHKVEILNELYEDMKREARRPENQLEVVVVDAGNDAVKQLGDIESFIAQKYDGIFFLALPSEGLEQLIARATAQGIFMFSHGASPVTGATQNVVLDQHFTGAQVGKFAGQWINQKHGGRAEVGVLGNSSDPWLQIRTQGLKDGLREAAPNARIVGEVHGHSIELSASGAANLLQAHPGIRVLLAHADDPGYGCFTAANEAGKRDPNEFCVASCDGTRLVMDKVAEGGIYQATWSYLFPLSATAWMRDMIRCLRGEQVPPTRTQVGRLVTQANVEQIRAMIRDPQAPDAQLYYSDPTVMRYSNESLESPSV
jgi:ribose transport system substrate-binding protein